MFINKEIADESTWQKIICSRTVLNELCDGKSSLATQELENCKLFLSADHAQFKALKSQPVQNTDLSVYVNSLPNNACVLRVCDEQHAVNGAHV